MGRCGTCRSQTQRFCFCHQEFVCEVCLVSQFSPLHNRCVINSYRKWVQDSAYEWPPKCPACSLDLAPEAETIRRICMHVEHAPCVGKSAPPDHPCAACSAPLQQSLKHADIGLAILRRVQSMPTLRALLPKVQSAYSETSLSNEEFVKGGDKEIEKMGRQGGLGREEAILRVVETEVGENISHVSRDSIDVRDVKSVGIVNGNVRMGTKGEMETRVDVGVPKGVGKWEKGSRNGNRLSRRARKIGKRKWHDLKKGLFANHRQILVVLLFIVCIGLIGFLASGDESETSTGGMEKQVVEDIRLPNIRVNPTLLREAQEKATNFANED